MLKTKFVFFLEVLIFAELYALGIFHNKNQINNFIPSNDTLPRNLNISEEWFDQYLDHFNPIDLKQWKQRFFTTSQYYKSGGPVFLMISGEGKAEKWWMYKAAWIDYAKRFRAMCFMLEHRFYGESHPTEDRSVQNIRYLTIEQALSDLATFISAMNERYNLTDKKWIVFGGSYAGSLAAWLRLKYPHLVHGAVSSSSVLLATMDFSDYFRVIAEVLKGYDIECEKAISDAFTDIDRLLQSKEGNQILDKTFRLCDPIEASSTNDIANLYLQLAINFAFIQYNGVNSRNKSSNIKLLSTVIGDICGIMTNKHRETPVERLADVNSFFMDGSCLNYKYIKMIEAGRNTSWDADDPASGMGRSWWYQVCTEFGNFQTSSFQMGTFGNKFPTQYFVDVCMDMFGPQYNYTVIEDLLKMRNTTYGGLDISVTNTVVVQGSIDPWHPGGITKNVTNGPLVIFIEGTTHCSDMWSETSKDLPQLKKARKQIIENIELWLQQ